MRDLLSTVWPLVPALILGALVAGWLRRAASAAEELSAEGEGQSVPDGDAALSVQEHAPTWERSGRPARFHF
jgi:hypothetical protein